MDLNNEAFNDFYNEIEQININLRDSSNQIDFFDHLNNEEVDMADVFFDFENSIINDQLVLNYETQINNSNDVEHLVGAGNDKFYKLIKIYNKERDIFGRKSTKATYELQNKYYESFFSVQEEIHEFIQEIYNKFIEPIHNSHDVRVIINHNTFGKTDKDGLVTEKVSRKDFTPDIIYGLLSSALQSQKNNGNYKFLTIIFYHTFFFFYLTYVYSIISVLLKLFIYSIKPHRFVEMEFFWCN